jgi:DegV family protein with EDD domain
MEQPTAPRRPTAVVTDSTAHLTEAEAVELGIEVVPLDVIIAGQTGLDGIEVRPEAVATALEKWEPVSTSRPAPARFLAAYENARHAGASEVVSIHLSGDLSGTVDAARVAAKEATLPVTVVDSRQIVLGLGFAVLDAARAAAAGADATLVADAASATAAATSTLFYVDTLEYLRRGGRIGAASAFLGGVLSIKPLLELRDGRIEPLEKVRTSGRALTRLQEMVLARAGEGAARVGIHHLAASERADMVRDSLTSRLPEASPILVRELGAVIGAHVGPGVVAVVVSPATSEA